MHDKSDDVSAGRPDWHAYLSGQLRDVGVPEVRGFRWWEGDHFEHFAVGPAYGLLGCGTSLVVVCMRGGQGMTNTRCLRELLYSCEGTGKSGLVRGGIHPLVCRGRLNVLLHRVGFISTHGLVPVVRGEVLLVRAGAPVMGCTIG